MEHTTIGHKEKKQKQAATSTKPDLSSLLTQHAAQMPSHKTKEPARPSDKLQFVQSKYLKNGLSSFSKERACPSGNRQLITNVSCISMATRPSGTGACQRAPVRTNGAFRVMTVKPPLWKSTFPFSRHRGTHVGLRVPLIRPRSRGT